MARLVLSVAALCLAVYLVPGILSEKARKGGDAIPKDSVNVDDDVWLFHFGPAELREEYLDPLTGEVKGYYVDVLECVCEIADKNCQIVYDLQSNCWDNVDGVPVGGFGLFNFYYDACVGWLPTNPRVRTFKFSDSLNQNKKSGFAVLAGNPDNFEASDLTDKKIGFVRGFFTSPDCVAMQGDDAITGSALSEEQIMNYATINEAKEALVNDEVAALFVALTDVENQAEFEFLNDDPPLYCAADGAAMMMRKDNGLKSWFDPALQELLASNKYQEICERIEEEHGDKPGGNRDDICLEI